MYLLDSSVAIEMMTKGKRFESALSFTGNSEIAISSPTVHEVLAGIEHIDENWNKLLAGVIILDYDKQCAEISAKIDKEMSKIGKKLGIFDMLIASVAVRNNLTLVTFDKDFSRIKNLDVKILS